MESSEEVILPLAILVSLIYEGKDDDLIKAANEVISKKGMKKYNLL